VIPKPYGFQAHYESEDSGELDESEEASKSEEASEPEDEQADDVEFEEVSKPRLDGYDDEYEEDSEESEKYSWLKGIRKEVTSDLIDFEGFTEPELKSSCEAKLIARDLIRANFPLQMEGVSQQITQLAFGPFDRYGQLTSEPEHHAVRKGSGVWKSSLDRGDILLMEEVWVSKACRGRGLGKKMVKAVLKKALANSPNHVVFVWPRFLNIDDLASEARELKDTKDHVRFCASHEQKSINFFRSLGFGRVGSTC